MWTLVYREPYDVGNPRGEGQIVTLMKSSEAAARQDFAAKVKAAPAEGYAYVQLVHDGVVIQSWPD